MKILTTVIINDFGKRILYIRVLEDNVKNYWTYNEIIDKYETVLGNRYAAVQAISREARKRAEDNENRISHSDALAWVILGEEPAQLSDPRYLPMTESEVLKKNTDDYILNIDDEEVGYAVHKSIDLSIENQYISYDYCNLTDESRKARLRILVNLIWDRVYLDRY